MGSEVYVKRHDTSILSLMAFALAAFCPGGCTPEPGFAPGDDTDTNYFDAIAKYAGPCVTELDRGELGPDETVDEWTVFFYDGDYVVKEEFDGNADGAFDTLKEYTYDSDGNVLTEARDGIEWSAAHPQNGADGATDMSFLYTYDGNGNMTKLEQDGHGPDAVADGSVDRRVTFTYDVSGNMIESVEDLNADDAPDIIIAYTYDEHGNPLTRETDGTAWEPSDGTVDKLDTFAYEYDSSGNMTKQELDLGADDNLDMRTVYTYDSMGNVLTLSEVWFLDVDNFHTENAYDEQGYLLTHRYCTNGFCITDTYTYDMFKNVLTLSYSNDNYTNGPLELTNYWYACWDQSQ